MLGCELVHLERTFQVGGQCKDLRIGIAQFGQACAEARTGVFLTGIYEFFHKAKSPIVSSSCFIASAHWSAEGFLPCHLQVPAMKSTP